MADPKKPNPLFPKKPMVEPKEPVATTQPDNGVTGSVLDDLEDEEEFEEPPTEVIPDTNVVIKDGQVTTELRMKEPELEIKPAADPNKIAFSPVDQSQASSGEPTRRVIPRISKNIRVGNYNLSLEEGKAVNVPASAVLHLRQKNII